MTAQNRDIVTRALDRHRGDPARMLDILRDVQTQAGDLSDEAIGLIAETLKLSRVDVEGVVTFYHFFSKDPTGKYAVYLDNSAVSEMKGFREVKAAFEKAAGCVFGSVSPDGTIGLFCTSCIGMSDQGPAAIINDTIFTGLTPEKAERLVASMKAGKKTSEMAETVSTAPGSGGRVASEVASNIRKKGQVLLAPFDAGSAVRKAADMTPEQIIEEIKVSNLRGRGGAGFPTGMKWEFTRNSEGNRRFIVCNADEGEPGTFKDRVILTETPELLFEGMAVGGRAIGAAEGILYLRAEYTYLKDHLESVLGSMKTSGLLGKDIAGSKGFDFDISIIMGAGAYVCGEESALLESAEGKRGQPRNRPPFPAQKGYMEMPTSVNNVETFCCAARIILEGGAWFASMGTLQSKGTKLVSVSGDCKMPGIYELEFGTTVKTLLEECGALDAVAVQVGGPSGTCVGKKDFGRRICFDDLATGGSVIVMGPKADILRTVHNFMDFFIEESCGWCVPCRAGNRILTAKLEKIMHGHGTATDLAELESWCGIVKSMSRCGLGQTSPNPILSTMKNFPELYQSKLLRDADYGSEFDLASAVKDSCAAAGRKPLTGGH